MFAAHKFADPGVIRQVLLLAYREVSLDGLHLRYGRENSRWANQVSYLSLGYAGNAVHQRSHFCELQAQLGLFHLRFVRFQNGGSRRICLNVIIKLRLRNGALLCQRRVTLYIEGSFAKLGLSLSLLSLCLLQSGFKGTRIDFKQHVTLMHPGAFAISLLHEIAWHLWAYVSVHKPIQSGDPFAIHRHIFLLNADNLHFGWRRRRRLGLVCASHQLDQCSQEESAWPQATTGHSCT